MTRHRTPEQRKLEILDAATLEIDEHGWARLTMDAVARRSGLSKGAVYRFYANKREVALALFARLYSHALDVNMDEIVGWRQPVAETVTRLLLEHASEQEERRFQRVWLQLLPETIRDEGFARERERLIGVQLVFYRRLIGRILERDGIAVPLEFDRNLDTAMFLGSWLVEGLHLQRSDAIPTREKERLLKLFIDMMLEDAVLGHEHEGKG